MAIKVVRNQTGFEHITLEQAKDWLRFTDDQTDDDALIQQLIAQARELIENYLGSSIVETVVECTGTARTEILLPFGPVNNITSVVDENGDYVEYYYDGFYLKFGGGRYSVTSGSLPVNFVATYTAGYNILPQGLQLAMLETIAFVYENRGDSSAIMSHLWQNTNLMPYREKLWI